MVNVLTARELGKYSFERKMKEREKYEVRYRGENMSLARCLHERAKFGKRPIESLRLGDLDWETHSLRGNCGGLVITYPRFKPGGAGVVIKDPKLIQFLSKKILLNLVNNYFRVDAHGFIVMSDFYHTDPYSYSNTSVSSLVKFMPSLFTVSRLGRNPNSGNRIFSATLVPYSRDKKLNDLHTREDRMKKADEVYKRIRNKKIPYVKDWALDELFTI